ncbi:hemin uptake protein HemP [Verminephrobacter eiseniae]|uniref:hemin uptake protein HemP n=1 Tax=Verminephrobacter eiseniae TaxID=364317 RepID=UPI002238E687|nr:hemin uptake protein HemP [Verminephrobacter eiseniae]MCW5237579.1 hemin uptake protein HemP [Verminephrobacter eiseniae]
MPASMTCAPPVHYAPAEPPASLGTDAGVHCAATTARAAAVDSRALLRGQKAVAISHNGSVYRLQATKLGKLILTK